MKKYFAELIGTFVLVLFGCGSAVLAGSEIGFLGISFAFGVAVLVMVYSIGHISGCHINPAITFAMFLAKKISAKKAVWYAVFQFLGATLAAIVLAIIARGALGFDVIEPLNLGQNGFGKGYLGEFSQGAAFLTEVVFTAIFVFVVFAATSAKAHKKFAGIAIGLTLFVVHLVTIPVTGTSVNPARSFGPAFIAGGQAMTQLWLFIVAPLIGAIFAWIAWKTLTEEK